MSFSAAVQWWEDWQLRLLVLASLFFQYFLFAAAIVRKLRIPHWFRALIWLAYQGGDVVAIYALATLFIRHKEEGLATNPATAHLQTLWAPILLLHLGGQDGITAYSIEDNENWRRHLLVSVSQITVAIYVFRKSWWSGDKTLLPAAILLFVPGILKCLEKPWALKNATVTSIMNSSDSQLKETLDELDAVQKDIYSQAEYVQAAAECIDKLNSQQHEEFFDDEVADKPHHLFVDLGHPYSIRLQNLRLVSPLSAKAVHKLVRKSLSKAFDRLYTKDRASVGGLVRAAVALVTFVVIGLFHRRHRGVYDRADIVITYVLLGCTAALELVSACLVLWSGLPGPDDKLAQYNLVGYLARGEKHRRFSALARLLGLDRLRCTAAPEPSPDITKLVYDRVADGWKDYIWKSLYEQDAATGRWKRKPTRANKVVRAYWQFNDSRGQQTLKREGCMGRMAIEESLRMPFDESVVLWHLATEFCYIGHVDTGHDAVCHSRTLSNYMAYLLFIEPEMLIPGAKSNLFTATYHELRKMLKTSPEFEEELEPTEKKAPPLRAKNDMVVRKVIQKVKSTISHGSEDLVHKAWAVAHELIEFSKKKKCDFVNDQRVRGKKRKEVIRVLCCAKEKADEFIDIKNKKRDKFLNTLMEFMRSATEKAKEFIHIKSSNAEVPVERKKIFIKDMKEAKDKVELFIKEERAKKQTKEEEKESIRDFLQCAKNKAEEFIEREEEKTETVVHIDMEEKREKEKADMIMEFSENAMRVIQLAEVEKKLMDEAHLKEKLLRARKEAKDKADEFILRADKFIREEKEKNQTKEEKKITDLLESAKKKAYEFIKNEHKIQENRNPNAVEEEKSVLAVQEFSNHAGEAMKLVEKEKKNLADLMEMNLIANKEELHMTRGGEYADDKMWAVIQGVWVEMLCFSASRCRGYLHAKRLGNGGEYVSYVWLLLYYMGMETMPERMQRAELPAAVGDTGAFVEIPTDEEWDEEPVQVRRRRRTKSSAESAEAQRDLEIGLSPIV